MDKLGPFWSWKRPFWIGVMDGLALMPLRRVFGRKKSDAQPAKVVVPPTYDINDICGEFTDTDGVKHEWFDECDALAHLLLDQVCFVNQRKYVEIDGTIADSTTVIFMSCNDVFMWGCADGENLLNADIKPLFMMWHDDKKWGSTRWICIKRNEQPQGPIVRDMKKDGKWDAVMEALPKNGVDEARRKG